MTLGTYQPRGNSYDRRRRRQWLLDTYGDGRTVLCHLCLERGQRTVLTLATMTVDRLVPGSEGGRYVRGNILPACKPCQDRQGGEATAALRAMRKALSFQWADKRDPATVGADLPDYDGIGALT